MGMGGGGPSKLIGYTSRAQSASTHKVFNGLKIEYIRPPLARTTALARGVPF